jgi:hypothetical protein
MGVPGQPALRPWAEPSTATALISNGQSGDVAFDVTSDIQSFVSGSTPNYGWIIKKDLEGRPGAIEFDSRESASGTGPRLVLTYEIPGNPPPAADLVQPYEDPVLTDDQRTAAISTLEADASFNQLLQGEPFSIAEVTPWGENAGPGLVGAVVTINLDQPTAISGDWPELVSPDDGSSAPQTQFLHLDLTQVTSIDAYISFDTDSVLALDPNPDAVWAGASPWTPPTSALLALSSSLLTQSPSAVVRSTSRSFSRFASRTRVSRFPLPSLVATDLTDAGGEDNSDSSDYGRASKNLHLVCPDGVNCFYNFDFSTKAKDQNLVAWNLVDWPVTAIWTGNANIDKVKLFLLGATGWGSSGSPMAASLDTAIGGWAWDTDKGVKEDPCSFHHKTPHTRLYAPPDTDFMYSAQYGYYIIGTSHYDWGECVGFWSKYLGWHYGGAGYSEASEKAIDTGVNNAVDGGWAVYPARALPDNIPLQNAEHFHHGDHFADFDGEASQILLDACDYYWSDGTCMRKE